jgi:hypothetical protein
MAFDECIYPCDYRCSLNEDDTLVRPSVSHLEKIQEARLSLFPIVQAVTKIAPQSAEYIVTKWQTPLEDFQLGNQQKKCAMTEVVCEICRKTNLVI